MEITKKYNSLRHLISDGDLILFHGNGFVAKIIQNCSKSYWNHIGVIIEKHGALFIVDANADGVQADRLSWRISKYKNGGDFCIIKRININAKDESLKDYAMENLLKRSDDKWIKYDFKNGIKELLNRKFDWNLKIKLRDDKAICSSNDAQYAITREIVTKQFEEKRINFPVDYYEFRNKQNTQILGI